MREDRMGVLEMVVELSCSIDLIETRIREFAWDYDGLPFELKRAHIIHVLKRYLVGELNADEVGRWANMLEGRDDICFESGSEGRLDRAIYELANPYLTAPLDEMRANNLVEILSG